MAARKKVERKGSNEDQGPGEGACPPCSLCPDDDLKAAAVKFCGTCGVLYCKKCLSTHHPMRGPLKRHRLMSMDEYRESGRGDPAPAPDPAQDPTQDPVCKTHSKPFCSYCTTCQELICTSCVTAHVQHNFCDIHQACIIQKAVLERKTKQCAEVRDKMQECISGFKKLLRESEVDADKRKEEMMCAYNEAVAALQVWRQNALDAVENQRQGLTANVDYAMELLHLKLAQMDRTSRQQQAEAMPGNPGTQTVTSEPNGVTSQPPTSEEPILQSLSQGQDVTKPLLKFVRTNYTELNIREKGRVIQGMKIVLADAWTDGAFQAGLVYWELTMIVTKVGPRSERCPCLLGVVHDTDNAWASPGVASWGLGMSFDDHFKCQRLSEGTEITPAYQDWVLMTGNVLLGFLLDCPAATLTVVDCRRNRVMASVRDLDVTQPLIPAVSVAGNVHMFARLVALDDNSTVPS